MTTLETATKLRDLVEKLPISAAAKLTWARMEADHELHLRGQRVAIFESQPIAYLRVEEICQMIQDHGEKVFELIRAALLDCVLAPIEFENHLESVQAAIYEQMCARQNWIFSDVELFDALGRPTLGGDLLIFSKVELSDADLPGLCVSEPLEPGWPEDIARACLEAAQRYANPRKRRWALLHACRRDRNLRSIKALADDLGVSYEQVKGAVASNRKKCSAETEERIRKAIGCPPERW